jgi:hypothetical protein
MKVTTSGLTRWAGLSAVVAGLLFVAIQVVHPPDTVASVTEPVWAYVHYASLAMVFLFLIGITGIYARQVEQVGWMGLIGVLVLAFALLLNAAGEGIEAFAYPLIAESSPAFVEGFLATVSGKPTAFDLGALSTVWAVSSVCFPLGSLLLGVATLRAGILPRVASALFAFGLLLAIPLVAITGVYRLAAVPIGLGLAWLGYALWSERRERISA